VGASSAAQPAYTYDLADRITQVTYPSGRIVQYGRKTKGRVNLVQTKASASVGSWTVLADNFAYEPFAAMKTVRFGNGLSAANDWGNDGRLASHRLRVLRPRHTDQTDWDLRQMAVAKLPQRPQAHRGLRRSQRRLPSSSAHGQCSTRRTG